MVQVIGEVGGSSSRWAVITADGGVSTFPVRGERWSGFNPVSGDGGIFATEIERRFRETCTAAMEAGEVSIYGAGCGSEDRRKRMAEAIHLIWPQAHIVVDSDLMGAALGLCGNTPALTLILGTGMNAGYFDGTRLHRPMPSLGYLLGDEASGADLGRQLLQDAYYNRIPEATAQLIFGGALPRLSEVLERIHGASHPARELATFTALLAPHLDDAYVRELIQSRLHALAELLVQYFKPEWTSTVCATGSVAFGFRELLAEVLLDRGMTLSVVEPDPLLGLVGHHRRQGV